MEAGFSIKLGEALAEDASLTTFVEVVGIRH